MTLIANTLSPDAVNHITAVTPVMKMQWLEPNRACDIVIHTFLPEKTLQYIRSFAHQIEADFFYQPLLLRRKKLLICDMDSTIIAQECIDELAGELGIKDKVAAITRQAMEGKIDFQDALYQRIALLKGLKESALQDVFDRRISLTTGARVLVQTMRQEGAHCMLVSGGFTFFTQRVMQQAGFHEAYANTLDIQNGVVTGQIVGSILDKDAKLRYLQNKVQNLSMDMQAVLAVGDGANDIPMLEVAGLGVGYYPHEKVRQYADAVIEYTDLSSLLYAQGFTKREWVYD